MAKKKSFVSEDHDEPFLCSICGTNTVPNEGDMCTICGSEVDVEDEDENNYTGDFDDLEDEESHADFDDEDF